MEQKPTNLSLIKKEFERDEQILESAFRLERLFKKYKYWVITIGVVLVGWVGYIIIYDMLEQKRAKEVSALYSELIQDPNNEVLRNGLKQKAGEIYDLFLLAHLEEVPDLKKTLQELKNSQNHIVQEIATYTLASLEQTGLSDIKGAFAPLAKLQEAYLLLSTDRIEEGRLVLESIDSNTSLYGFSSQMKHYGITRYPLNAQSDLRIQEVQDTTTKTDSIESSQDQASSSQ